MRWTLITLRRGCRPSREAQMTEPPQSSITKTMAKGTENQTTKGGEGWKVDIRERELSPMQLTRCSTMTTIEEETTKTTSKGLKDSLVTRVQGKTRTTNDLTGHTKITDRICQGITTVIMCKVADDRVPSRAGLRLLTQRQSPLFLMTRLSSWLAEG